MIDAEKAKGKMFQGDIQWMLRETARREMLAEAEHLRLVKRLSRQSKLGRCRLSATRLRQGWRERCAQFAAGTQE